MLVAIGIADAFVLGVLSSRPHLVWTLHAGGTLEDRPRYQKSLCFDPFPFPDCSETFKDRIRAVAEELDAHRKARQVEHPRLTLTQMYNVLEKLKAGEHMDEDDESTKAQGLVLILRELHDQLDSLVAEAYGWPTALPDEEILERVVALNADRVREERGGKVGWLRPEFQIPRFGSEVERARLEEERRRARDEKRARPQQSNLTPEDDLEEAKQRFPTGDELAETAAIIGVLRAAQSALSIDDISRHFSQGRQVERRVASTVLALARLGHLASSDGGNTFTLHPVA
jgi:hypothetical protein